MGFRGVLFIVVLGVGLGLFAGAAAASPACGDTHWVGAWAASPSGAKGPDFTDQTLRLIVQPTLGGKRVRVRFSNRFGSGPVRFSSATIARRASGARVVGGTLRRLLFGRKGAATILPGREIRSDPVDLSFRAFQELAVSVHVRGQSGAASGHLYAMQTSYATAPRSEDATREPGGGAFTERLTGWSFLRAVDVLATRRVGAVVALGDSLTDGLGSAPDRNARYPDALARRLAARGPRRQRLSVLNAGLSGNALLRGSIVPGGGLPAPYRLEEDVSDSGVTDVLVMEGTNDLGLGSDAASVIGGLEELVARIHQGGRRAIVGTIPPSKDSEAVAARNRVNDWIRTSGVPDAMADFNTALADPQDRDRLRPEFDVGDHLHLNDAGYRAMADAVPLGALRGPACAHPIRLGVVPRRAKRGVRTRFVLRPTIRRGARHPCRRADARRQRCRRPPHAALGRRSAPVGLMARPNTLPY